MGFKVNENVPFCYNGVPTADILKLNQVKRGWKNKKNQATVDITFFESLKMFLSNFKLLAMIFFYGALIATFFYAFYEFNVWQIRLEEKQKAMKEREARILKVKERRAARKAEKQMLEEQVQEVKKNL
jgi:uncharacterized membrane protein (DUF106 family)